MSVNFYNPANPADYNEETGEWTGGTELNVSNVNARDLLAFLGLDLEGDNDDLYGQILAKDLEVLCRRRLMVASVKGNDPALPTTEEGNFINCGRGEGYLVEKTKVLLKIAQERKSDEDRIVWS